MSVQGYTNVPLSDCPHFQELASSIPLPSLLPSFRGSLLQPAPSPAMWATLPSPITQSPFSYHPGLVHSRKTRHRTNPYENIYLDGKATKDLRVYTSKPIGMLFTSNKGTEQLGGLMSKAPHPILMALNFGTTPSVADCGPCLHSGTPNC